jgi:cyclic-di-GMP-binding protein
MNDRYRRLLRATPERHAPTAGAFATEARALRAWVAALPLANFGATAKLLRDGLHQVNRMRIDAVQRLDALEILRNPVAQLAVLTDKQIVGASFPLPPQKVELGAIALEFQSELALGYRIALAELCAPAGNVPFMRAKQVALAGVRALQHGGEHLAKSYLLYRTPPPGVWQSLHDVYRFMTMVRFDDRPVEDPLLGGAVNARLAYAHALLLALANPYRYTQRELSEVIAFTRTVAPYCELRAGAGADGDLTMNTDSDHGPGYLPEERGQGEIEVLSIGLKPLLAFIESQIDMLPPGARVATFRLRGGPPVQVEIDLAHRLVDGWTATGERTHTRLGGGYPLDTVLGLHDLHFVLAGNEDFESFLRRVRGQAISLSESDRIASWAISASEPARATRLKARVLDQSLGGYRLVWERGPGGEAVRARIGELVGLALPETGDGAPDWMIGTIRWIRIDAEGRVDAGVELLSRRALPVGVRPIEEGGLSSAVRGLLLTSLRPDEADPTSLITPGLFERGSSAVEISIPADLQGKPAPARTERVRGMGLIEATGIYMRFALPPLNSPDAGSANDAGDAIAAATG